jgi:hypothetical protein
MRRRSPALPGAPAASRRHGVFVTRWHEQAVVPVRDHVGYAADRGRHHGQARGHRLDRRDRRALVDRTEHQRVEGPVHGRQIRAPAVETHGVDEPASLTTSCKVRRRAHRRRRAPGARAEPSRARARTRGSAWARSSPAPIAPRTRTRTRPLRAVPYRGVPSPADRRGRARAARRTACQAGRCGTWCRSRASAAARARARSRSPARGSAPPGGSPRWETAEVPVQHVAVEGVHDEAATTPGAGQIIEPGCQLGRGTRPWRCGCGRRRAGVREDEADERRERA